jgi:hypothetical protein
VEVDSVNVKALGTCRVTVNGVTPMRLMLNEDVVRRVLRDGYRILDTTVRGWSGFNAFIETPSHRVPGIWSSYLARFEPGGIDVAVHPEAAIGRPVKDACSDELLNWHRARPLTDAAGLVVAVSVETEKLGAPAPMPPSRGRE